MLNLQTLPLIMLTATNTYNPHAYEPRQNPPLARAGGESGNRQRLPFSADQQDDTVTLSPDGQEISRNSSSNSVNEQSEKPSSMQSKGSDQQRLTEEELKQLTELKRRDREVKTHEQAHLAAAGQYAAGGASFSYQNGPDGKRYAIGGEVPIDIGKERSPEATVLKMRTVKRAALAPANPSPADRSIAASATAKEAQAMKEIMLNSGPSPNEKSIDDREPESITPTDDLSAVQENNTPAVPISEFSRRTMNAAYQDMAGLAT